MGLIVYMENEIELIKSRVVAKEVVRRFDSDLKDKLHIFGTRNYYPKGERFRRILKEILALVYLILKIKLLIILIDHMMKVLVKNLHQKFLKYQS